MSQHVRLDFDNLPLVEVAVRATLEKPIAIKFSLLSKMHEELRDCFPTLSEPRYRDVPPGVAPQFTIGTGQIPGAVFEGHKEGLAISVFPDLLVARWQRPPAASLPDYPRFPALREALCNGLDAMRKAQGNENMPTIKVVNMSYVNLPRIAHAEPVLQDYFSRKAHVEFVRDAKIVHKAEVSWREHDGFDLRYCLEAVSEPIDEQTIEAYCLTTVGGMCVQPPADVKSCLDTVHDRMQRLFRDLISDHAKRVWGFKEA